MATMSVSCESVDNDEEVYDSRAFKLGITHLDRIGINLSDCEGQLYFALQNRRQLVKT